MMCLECELEFFDEYDGIIELFQDVFVGVNYVEWVGFDEFVIEIGLMFNWFDCIGVYGIVCDLVVMGIGKLKECFYDQICGIYLCLIIVLLDFGDIKLMCKVFGLWFVKGVKNGLLL